MKCANCVSTCQNVFLVFSVLLHVWVGVVACVVFVSIFCQIWGVLFFCLGVEGLGWGGAQDPTSPNPSIICSLCSLFLGGPFSCFCFSSIVWFSLFCFLFCCFCCFSFLLQLVDKSKISPALLVCFWCNVGSKVVFQLVFGFLLVCYVFVSSFMKLECFLCVVSLLFQNTRLDWLLVWILFSGCLFWEISQILTQELGQTMTLFLTFFGNSHSPCRNKRT